MQALTGSLKRSTGSATWEQGSTSVVAAAWAPIELKSKREDSLKATLQVLCKPKLGAPTPREKAMENLIQPVLQHLVKTDLYPSSTILIVLQIVHDDGSLLSAALHAACAALLHARIALRGLLGGCTMAINSSGQVLLDPNADEEVEAQQVLTLSYFIATRDEPAVDATELLLSHVGSYEATCQLASSSISSQNFLAGKHACCAVNSFMRDAMTEQDRPILDAERQRALALELVRELQTS